MKVGVVGKGGREHALVYKIWKDAQQVGMDDSLSIFAFPGNPGIARYATCIETDDVASIVAFCVQLKLDLVIIGPEKFLSDGLVDALEKVGIKAFGPNKLQAKIEISKVFFRELSEEFGIPIAKGHICENLPEALAVLTEMKMPVVVKPDGPTGGHGVRICYRPEEAVSHIKKVMVDNAYKETGDSGRRIILEEKLKGPEASYTIIVCNGRYIELATAEDHKQRFDGDQGDMTGGMGAYSPSIIADAYLPVIRQKIAKPLLAGLKKYCGGYKGVLYIALMITAEGPKVLEVNARFGDPEIQVILDRMQSPLLPILWEVANNNIVHEPQIEWNPDFSLALSVVSKKYPINPKKYQVITGLDRIENGPESTPESPITVCHAGTAWRGDELIVVSGRVYNVVGRGKSVLQANLRTRSAAKRAFFEEMDWRQDIGLRPPPNFPLP